MRDDKILRKTCWFLIVLLAGIGILAIVTGIVTSSQTHLSFLISFLLGGFIGGFTVGALSEDLLRGIFGGLSSSILGPIICYVIVYFYKGYYYPLYAIEEGLKMGLLTARWLWFPATIGAVLGFLVMKKGMKRTSTM